MVRNEASFGKMKKIKLEQTNEQTAQDGVVSLVSQHLRFLQDSQRTSTDQMPPEVDEVNLEKAREDEAGFNLTGDDGRPSGHVDQSYYDDKNNHELDVRSGSNCSRSRSCSRSSTGSSGSCGGESLSNGSQATQKSSTKLKEVKLEQRQAPDPRRSPVVSTGTNSLTSQLDLQNAVGQVQQFVHQQQQPTQQSPLAFTKSNPSPSKVNFAPNQTLVAASNGSASINTSGSQNNNSNIPHQLPPAAPGTPANFCHLCKKELCNKYFMKTHMQKMHGINLDDYPREAANSGGVVCDICQKELCSKYFLKVHKSNTHGITDFTGSSAGSQAANAATAVAAIALTNYSLNNAQKRAALNLALSQHQLQNRQAAALMNAAVAFNPLQPVGPSSQQKTQLSQTQQRDHLAATSIIGQLQHPSPPTQQQQQHSSQSENSQSYQAQQQRHLQQHQQQSHTSPIPQTSTANSLAGLQNPLQAAFPAAALLAATSNNPLLAAQLAAQHQQQQRHHQEQQFSLAARQGLQPAFGFPLLNSGGNGPVSNNHEMLDQTDTDPDDASDRDSLTDLTSDKQHQQQQLLMRQQQLLSQHNHLLLQQQQQLFSNKIATQISQTNQNPMLFPTAHSELDNPESDIDDASDRDSLVDQSSNPIGGNEQQQRHLQQQLKDRLAANEFNQHLQSQQQAILSAMMFNPAAAAAAMMAMQQQQQQQNPKQLSSLIGSSNFMAGNALSLLNTAAQPTNLVVPTTKAQPNQAVSFPVSTSASTAATTAPNAPPTTAINTLNGPSSTIIGSTSCSGNNTTATITTATATATTNTTANTNSTGSRNQLNQSNSSRYLRHYTEACPICDRRFKSIKWLQSHVMNDHKNEIGNLFNLLVQILLCSNASNSGASSSAQTDQSQQSSPSSIGKTPNLQQQNQQPAVSQPSPLQLQQQLIQSLSVAGGQLPVLSSSNNNTNQAAAAQSHLNANGAPSGNELIAANLSNLAAISGLGFGGSVPSSRAETFTTAAGQMGVDLSQHQDHSQFQASSLTLDSKSTAASTTANRE